MNALVRLNFATKQLALNDSVLGRFITTSKTEGTVELGKTSYTYVIHPCSYGYTITLFQAGHKVAFREYDGHDGIFSLCIGGKSKFDLKNEALYCPKGRAGKVLIAEQELGMEFNSLVPVDCLALVSVMVALDTMWANLVGFTRTRAKPCNPKERSADKPDTRPLSSRLGFMNRCPHCGSRARLMKLLFITRKRPYCCPSCGKNSRLLPHHNTIASLLTLVFGFVCALLIAPQFGLVAAVATFVVLYTLLGFVVFFFMQLTPCRD